MALYRYFTTADVFPRPSRTLSSSISLAAIKQANGTVKNALVFYMVSSFTMATVKASTRLQFFAMNGGPDIDLVVMRGSHSTSPQLRMTARSASVSFTRRTMFSEFKSSLFSVCIYIVRAKNAKICITRNIYGMSFLRRCIK